MPDLSDLGVIALVGGLSVFAATILTRAYWRLRSSFQIWKAGERRMHAAGAAIWRSPGNVGQLDLATGPGGPNGAPREPLVFVEEHLSGSHPCISVHDAAGRTWRVKWGDEVQAETLATRLAWTAGYFVETT
jgi:hypothetical protein